MNNLFLNGMFYVGDERWSPAVLVDENGLITRVFSDAAEAAAYVSSDMQTTDMGGAWVVPGFEDAHTHPAGRARTLAEIDVRGRNLTWEEARTLIRERAQALPPNQWIVCHGWNESAWGKLSQDELDRISGDHGIFLINISYHGGILNAKGEALLTQQGVSADIQDGRVTEDAFERTLAATAPDTAAYMQTIPRYLEKLTARGIVAAHDMHVATLQQLEAYARLDEQGLLAIPILAYINPRLLHEPEIKKYLSPTTENFRVAGAKIFLDGAIGTSTAAMRESYADGTGRGMLRTDAATARDIVKQAAALGLQHIAIHCIGDRAVDTAITEFETLRAEYVRDIALWRFEHFELPDERAIRVLAAHGSIASMQPNFSWDAENYRTRLGDRIKNINPFRDVLDAGAILAFGSDDMPSGPIPGLAWAVAQPPVPEQGITMPEALAAYTATPAAVAGASERRGKIAVGHEANFAVMSDNLFAVPPPQISAISIVQTWIRGKKVFG